MDGMSRDHRKLRVFTLADELAIDIYRSTKDFPVSERFGLQSQLRRVSRHSALVVSPKAIFTQGPPTQRPKAKGPFVRCTQNGPARHNAQGRFE
jgi:hypothetical protein